MAPAITLDMSDDFDIPTVAPAKPHHGQRTLLIAAPSVAAHQEALERVFEAHDRASTDIQMLDRLAMGLVSLPQATYDVILLLTDADGTRAESQRLLDRKLMGKLVQALKIGGSFRSQDGKFGTIDGSEKTEAILAGLIAGSEGFTKPDNTASESVPLRLGKKKANANGNGTPSGTLPDDGTANGTAPMTLNGKRKSDADQTSAPAGVGFVDFSDDLDMITAEDELVDEDDLLTEEDRLRPVMPRKFSEHLPTAPTC